MAVKKVNKEDILLATLTGYDLFFFNRCTKYAQFTHQCKGSNERHIINIDTMCEKEGLNKRTVTTKWFPKMRLAGWTITAQGKNGNYELAYGQEEVEETVEEIVEEVVEVIEEPQPAQPKSQPEPQPKPVQPIQPAKPKPTRPANLKKNDGWGQPVNKLPQDGVTDWKKLGFSF